MPRNRSHGRPRAHICGRRWNGSGGGGAESGQGAVYRIHRAQEPGHSSEDAGDGGRAPFSLRHVADAAERDGCSLQQLSKESAAGTGEEGDRRVGDEADGRRTDSAQQDRGTGGMLALCDESSDQRGDYWMRFCDVGAAGGTGGEDIQADERDAGGGAAGEDKRRGAKWRIRGIQDHNELRWHHAQPAVVGVRRRVPRRNLAQKKINNLSHLDVENCEDEAVKSDSKNRCRGPSQPEERPELFKLVRALAYFVTAKPPLNPDSHNRRIRHP